ncbi:MAG: hypothetical protein QXI60_07440 [Thermofilaceae archaeon]
MRRKFTTTLPEEVVTALKVEAYSSGFKSVAEYILHLVEFHRLNCRRCVYRLPSIFSAED